MAKIIFCALCLLVPSLCFAKAELKVWPKDQATHTQPALPEMPLEHHEPCDLNDGTEEMLRRIEEISALNCTDHEQGGGNRPHPGKQDDHRRRNLSFGCG